MSYDLQALRQEAKEECFSPANAIQRCERLWPRKYAECHEDAMSPVWRGLTWGVEARGFGICA